jgi:hypothetical protein
MHDGYILRGLVCGLLARPRFLARLRNLLEAVTMLPLTAVTVYGSRSHGPMFRCFLSLARTWLPTLIVGSLAGILRLYSNSIRYWVRALFSSAIFLHLSPCSGVSGISCLECRNFSWSLGRGGRAQCLWSSVEFRFTFAGIPLALPVRLNHLFYCAMASRVSWMVWGTRTCLTGIFTNVTYQCRHFYQCNHTPDRVTMPWWPPWASSIVRVQCALDMTMRKQ